MASRIVLPAVVLLVALAFGSGDALQCYECISIGAASDCNSEIIMKDVGSQVTCTMATIGNWETKMAGHAMLREISKVFHIDDLTQSFQNVPMSCLKINLEVDNQPVTLKTCQDTNTPGVNPCQTIRDRISKNHSSRAKVPYCELCEGDRCNGSYMLSPTIVLSMIPLLGSIAMNRVYSSA